MSLIRYLHPAFGGKPSKEQRKWFSTLDNYENGKFVYRPPAERKSAAEPSPAITASHAKGKTSPSGRLPVRKIDWDKINSKEDSLVWLGHSTFMLTIDNKKMLFDPMFGPAASPVTFLGPKRYSENIMGIMDEMPAMDAVFLTHDHYDHLDYPSITQLKNRVDHFFVPCGVSSHLIRWGVAAEKITELNWWVEAEFQGLTIALTPSRHFSGRGVLNRNTTLWGGWVILGKQTRFYNSGDGGYGGHFKEIGDKYGPFDITIIEGGQYNKHWAWAHMFPEQAVQAHIDIKGRTMLLAHWGAFTLSRHGWSEPIERALKEAEEKNIHLIAPRIGETVQMNGRLTAPASPWWEEVD
ncbi:MBL fold metallo-hydrolase [Alkalicoccus halolimnae]|uniref:MBL fold metallo-hydrolase n=1 Tax=Alkalicoccus halolimnae TaxID=1667239 RepID=UPI003BB0C283